MPRAGLAFTLATALVVTFATTACSDEEEGQHGVPVPGHEGARKSTPLTRAARRAFDGAPPVVPHGPLGANCLRCHVEKSLEIPNLGFAPPSPHGNTPGMSDVSRCNQCHVYQVTDTLFVENDFHAFPQDLREGERMFEGAPPTMPHGFFMRENCLACHDGPAAREYLRTSHPERGRCVQCHVPVVTETEFVRE